MRSSVRSFLLGKQGEPDGRQDALACSPERGLYAVADGVSNSFHPELVARGLCEAFVRMDPADLAAWERCSVESLLPQVREAWVQGVNAHFATLSGRLLRHEQYNYETWRYGASTFCGVALDRAAGLVRYVVIGDSTLFVSTRAGRLLAVNAAGEMESGLFAAQYVFSNVTEAVLSNGSLSGHWRVGAFPLEEVASLALMTDGMAKWYQHCLSEGGDPEGMLWGIDSPDGFAGLAAACRERQEMDDDLAVVLVACDVEPVMDKGDM